MANQPGKKQPTPKISDDAFSRETTMGQMGGDIETNIRIISPVLNKVLARMREEGLMKMANKIASESLDPTDQEVIAFIMKCESLKQEIIMEMDENNASEQDKQIVRNYFKQYLGNLRS